MEYGYAFTGIVFYEQGIIQALRAARGAAALRPGSSDIVSTLTQGGLLAVLAVLLFARRRQYLPALRHLAPYAAIILLCFASTAWSDNPLPTMRRALSLLSCVLFGMYLQQRFGLHGAIVLAGRSAVFLGLLSVAVFLAAPGIGRETALGYGDAMRGVFSQKNPMAECMLLGITCTVYRALDEGLRRRHLAALLVLLLCIALSRSATSLGLSALVLLAGGLMAARQRPKLRLLLGSAAIWLLLAIITLAVAEPDLLWRLLGRDASLTGRGPLWQQVVLVIGERPLLGHGYAGFWNENSRAVQYLWLLAGWQAPDSHNGYLEIAVELGLAGVCAYLFLWGRVIRRALLAHGGLRERDWIVLFMLVNVVLNLDEGPMPFSQRLHPAHAGRAAFAWSVAGPAAPAIVPAALAAWLRGGAMKVSVIIPTANRPEQLVCALRSVFAQTLPPLEAIVVMDGPDPHTAALLAAWPEPRLRWLQLAASAGAGAGAARNYGAARASGDWLAFLDDDDEWLPEKLARQAAAAAGRAMLVSCRSYVRSGVPGKSYGRACSTMAACRSTTICSIAAACSVARRIWARPASCCPPQPSRAPASARTGRTRTPPCCCA